MKKTEKIDFRTFLNGSPKIEKNTRSFNKIFGLAPVYVPGGDFAFYGLLTTAGVGLLIVGMSYLEHLSLKSGSPTVLTVVLDSIQRALPIIFTGVLVYLIFTMPIWRWI